MHFFPQHLLFLSCFLLLTSFSPVSCRELVSAFSYEKPSDIHSWQLSGASTSSSHSLQLNPPVPHKKGGFWSKMPNQLTDWEVEFKFLAQKAALHEHSGFAFWFTKDASVDGDVFGNMNQWDGLSIMFDSGHLADSGVILGALNDGSVVYNLAERGNGQTFGSCRADFAPSGDSYPSVRVTFQDKKLSVSFQKASSLDFSNCFLVEGISFPAGYHFGFTSRTDSSAIPHELFHVKTFDLAPPQATPTNTLVNTNTNNHLPSSASASASASSAVATMDVAELTKKIESIVAAHVGDAVGKVMVSASDRNEAIKKDFSGKFEEVFSQLNFLRTTLDDYQTKLKAITTLLDSSNSNGVSGQLMGLRTQLDQNSKIMTEMKSFIEDFSNRVERLPARVTHAMKSVDEEGFDMATLFGAGILLTVCGGFIRHYLKKQNDSKKFF
eukprot:Sdes_comp14071_c0_seq1m3378